MNEDLSRLMDGDLDEAELDRVAGELRRPQALATWDCYHAIGDTLPDGSKIPTTVNPAFS